MFFFFEGKKTFSNTTQMPPKIKIGFFPKTKTLKLRLVELLDN